MCSRVFLLIVAELVAASASKLFYHTVDNTHGTPYNAVARTRLLHFSHFFYILLYQDVIAMRKTNGQISGQVLLNGHKQDPIGFRRSSGYVEQFDVQTPELTVKETLLFSARLRLDASEIKSDRKKVKFVNQVIRTLELDAFADSIIGSDEEGGLSFEQRKRVSIAVELAASPSVIFLDEVS